ncbi:hypothetical protein [Cupriavidus sp. BIC8F]|uniref:hypothetical protein n=1 Tax=Cupriavidus sp. BIC8F TaxID=3079014 RepID=UPI002915D624|nr:hypothetical protein [Cupriavidus sp. BIC8F]
MRDWTRGWRKHAAGRVAKSWKAAVKTLACAAAPICDLVEIAVKLQLAAEDPSAKLQVGRRAIREGLRR